MDGIVVHGADHVAGLHLAVEDPAGDHGAPVGVVVGVEDQGGEGRLDAPLGRRDLGDDGLQDLVDAEAFLGGAEDGHIRVQTQFPVDLLLDPLDVGRGQVDLVDHRDDGEVVLHGQIEVGQGLGLHPLGGVHQEQHPLAGGQGPGDFVGKIDVARGVDQVELVFFAVGGGVGQADGVALDGDAPLPFQVHGVEELVAELAVLHHAGPLDEAVRQGGLAVVDMGDDAEVADVGHILSQYS